MIRFLILSFCCSALLLSTPSASLACLWDRDTLAAEARGIPEVPYILTGRFFRYPQLYYTMRLTRVEKQISLRPEDLSLYDDAGVASDKLGKPQDAVQWMERKLRQLQAQDPDRTKSADHWYRYFANAGTFYIHDWIHRGAQKQDIHLLKKGGELIRSAIQINPDAHFGREKYQLKLVDWLLENLNSDEDTPHYTDIALDENEDAIRGLAGLIILGNAWESIDVIRGIESLAGSAGHSSVAYIAQRRIAELKNAGKTSILPGRAFLDPSRENMFAPDDLAALNDWYEEARPNADNWHQSKTDFMLKKLKTGKHPDTDKNFWDGFEDLEAVELPGSELFGSSMIGARKIDVFLFPFVLSLLVFGIILLRKAIVGRRESDS